MSAAKKYFKKEFQLSKFKLEHRTGSDFYISSWQRNKNALPLLCIRFLVLVGCLGILISSLVLMSRTMPFGYWFIFMTHWGAVMITVTSGFAFAISFKVYFEGPIDATFDLPWYVKTYWVLFNISTTLAFFITVYYFVFLAGLYDEDSGWDFEFDPVLDLFIHGINSVLMFVLLVTSRQPVHILHFFHPLAFGIFYLLFSVVYYFAGGTDPFGNAYIYPTLDWGEAPLLASLSVLFSAVAIGLIHLIVTGMAVGRNALTRRFVQKRPSTSSRKSADIPQYN